MKGTWTLFYTILSAYTNEISHCNNLVLALITYHFLPLQKEQQFWTSQANVKYQEFDTTYIGQFEAPHEFYWLAEVSGGEIDSVWNYIHLKVHRFWSPIGDQIKNNKGIEPFWGSYYRVFHTGYFFSHRE